MSSIPLWSGVGVLPPGVSSPTYSLASGSSSGSPTRIVSSSPGILPWRPYASTGDTPVRSASAATAVGETPRRDHSSTADKRGVPSARSSFGRWPFLLMDTSTLRSFVPWRQGFFDTLLHREAALPRRRSVHEDLHLISAARQALRPRDVELARRRPARCDVERRFRHHLGVLVGPPRRQEGVARRAFHDDGR